MTTKHKSNPLFFESSSFEVEQPLPQFALLFHTIRERCANTVNMVVTQHGVKQGHRGQPLIGVGQVFSHADMRRLRALLDDEGMAPPSTMILPPAVLAVGANHLVWWCRTRLAPMWFLNGQQQYQMTVPWPNLLFVVAEGELYCAALAKATRPTDSTPLFHAPLMNVDRQGLVCFGTADIPTDVTCDNRPDWEAVIYETNFSHVNHDSTMKLPRRSDQPVSDDDHIACWQQLEGKPRFPTQRLVPMHTTVGAFAARKTR